MRCFIAWTKVKYSNRFRENSLCVNLFVWLKSKIILGDYKRFGELFTADAEIEIPKVKVKKQGTQEIEGKDLLFYW